MASATLDFPPLDSSLLFPDLINFHMDRNPTFPIYVYANENVPNRLTEISLLEFGRATHRVAHALRPSRHGADGEIVVVLASTDTILYHAVVAGLSIATWVPFPVSLRNSATAIVHMMKKIGCSRIVTLNHAHRGLVESVRHLYGDDQLSVFELPTLRSVFPRLGKEVTVDPFEPYPRGLNRLDIDSPAIYVHSSGSTGFPKPIAHSYRIQAQWFARRSTGGFLGYSTPRRVASMALPPFHLFGIVTTLYVPIAYLVTAVVYAPHTEYDPLAKPAMPTSDNMIECLRRVPCNTLMTVPALLEPMAESEEAIDILKKLDFVCFGGGPLSNKVGQKLWGAGVKLGSGYGGTEFGVLVVEGNQKDIADGDWMWMRFPDEPKIRWAPQGDGTYELQLLSTENHLMVIENLPDVKGYATSDILVKHPTKDMWRIVGRADDLIILASGEKTIPGPMENVIGSSPLVRGVVMFGRERNQVGVLIEPREGYAIDVKDEKAVAEYRNQIWPAIEEANKPSPAFSRIFKEMILITSNNKPLVRSPKGSVQRKANISAYEAEINGLYEAVETSSVAPDSLVGPSTWTREVLELWLLEHARTISSSDEVDPHADLFAQGFDSLSAAYLQNRILGALRASPDPRISQVATYIPSNVIFENPTIQLLSARLAAFVDDDIKSTESFVDLHKKSINAMIDKYSVGLQGPADGVLPSSKSIEPAVVLLTGSTGGLGSFLLSELLKSSAVQRVYASNRPSSTKSVEQRQKLAFEDRGLSTELLGSTKLVYVEADASAEQCGLTAAQYSEIRDSVTLIIHSAWRLDFNLTISSFEDNIQASRNFVDLALGSPRRDHVRFLFTSSIGSAQGWDNARGPFPEEVQQDPSVAVGAGYGEGKYATERGIIVKSGLHATSLRIGQIAGGHGGSWTTTDWFPILVKSSVALGVLPESVGSVSWLREEDVASVILEASLATESPPPALNIVNPRGVPWVEIVASVRRSIIKRKALVDDVLPIIPLGDWFALLEKQAENASTEDLAEIPAIKLVEFFRALARGDQAIRALGTVTEAGGMTNFSTDKAQRVSPTMANMSAIGEVEADGWVGYWISKGVL